MWGLAGFARLSPCRAAVGGRVQPSAADRAIIRPLAGILGKGKQCPTRALLTAPSGLFLDNHGWIFPTPRQLPPFLGLQVWGRDSYRGGVIVKQGGQPAALGRVMSYLPAANSVTVQPSATSSGNASRTRWRRLRMVEPLASDGQT